jgi:hypothetical protein
MRWAGNVVRIGQKSSAYICSCVETLRGKNVIGNPRYRWKYNIRKYLERNGMGGRAWD